MTAGLLPFSSHAQGKYPERSIRLVIPFAPGGNTDILGRRFGAKITPLLGQQVVIEMGIDRQGDRLESLMIEPASDIGGNPHGEKLGDWAAFSGETELPLRWGSYSGFGGVRNGA